MFPYFAAWWSGGQRAVLWTEFVPSKTQPEPPHCSSCWSSCCPAPPGSVHTDTHRHTIRHTPHHWFHVIFKLVIFASSCDHRGFRRTLHTLYLSWVLKRSRVFDVLHLQLWHSHLSDRLPPLGQGWGGRMSNCSPAPTDLVVVDGNIQVRRHAPLNPGSHCAPRTKAHICYSQLSGSRRIGGIWGAHVGCY